MPLSFASVPPHAVPADADPTMAFGAWLLAGALLLAAGFASVIVANRRFSRSLRGDLAPSATPAAEGSAAPLAA